MNSYKHFSKADTTIIESGALDLYQYKVYLGTHEIYTSKKNSYWYLAGSQVISETGDDNKLYSSSLCVEIFGYTPEKRTSSYSKLTDLPYINGCSTKQLINPNRLGDPTWQMLYIPPHTMEQAHHIHSTTRIVYVLSGEGTSHMGQKENAKKIKLSPGDILVLDKMVPHHFSTEETGLVVLPLHVFSSIDHESNHPMFNGTHKI